MKRGLILSGGGARISWMTGVLKRLKETQPWDYRVVCGTSAGALAAPCAALGEIDALEEFVVNTKKDDVLQPRLLAEGPSAMWAVVTGADSVYTTSGLRKKIDEMLSPERWKRLQECDCEAVVCNVGLGDGDVNYPNSKLITNRTSFVLSILASASIPVAMPPVGHVLVDGGVREILPLEYAVEDGCTEIDCIVLSPKDLPPRRVPRTLLGILERTLDLLQAEVLKNDLQIGELLAMWLNTKIRVLQMPEFYTSALNFTPSIMRELVRKGYEYAQDGNWRTL
jgi:NTE family protein